MATKYKNKTNLNESETNQRRGNKHETEHRFRERGKKNLLSVKYKKLQEMPFIYLLKSARTNAASPPRLRSDLSLLPLRLFYVL
jgi:hypothetical protein